MHHNRLGKRPSERKPGSATAGQGDWRVVLPEMIPGLIDIIRGNRPLMGYAKIRAEIIDEFRTVLDAEFSDEEMRKAAAEAGHRTGQEMFGVPEVFRWLLAWGGYDWRNPTAAETVMAEAQRALDAELAKQMDDVGPKVDPLTGRKPTWQVQVVKATKQVAQMKGDEDIYAARARTMEAFEEALGPTPNHQFLSEMERPKEDGTGTETVEIISAPALFRMVLWGYDIDWYDEDNARRARNVVRATLDNLSAAA
jgi:hypothetical protein